MFDDDAWPQFEGWADSWAWASEYEGVGHSMYMVDLSKSPKANTKEHKSQPPVEVVGNLQYFRPWDNCMGVVLHFTRQCLTALGGYDYKRAVNVYGYEHAQMSRRAMLAGFTKGYTYLSPYNANDLIYSLDISFNWYGILPAFDAPWISALSSSTTAEEAAGHPRNAAMMNVGDPHVPLVDPIGNA